MCEMKAFYTAVPCRERLKVLPSKLLLKPGTIWFACGLPVLLKFDGTVFCYWNLKLYSNLLRMKMVYGDILELEAARPIVLFY